MDSKSRNLLKASVKVRVFWMFPTASKILLDLKSAVSFTLTINHLDYLVFCLLLPHTSCFIVKVFGELVSLSKKFSKEKLLAET